MGVREEMALVGSVSTRILVICDARKDEDNIHDLDRGSIGIWWVTAYWVAVTWSMHTGSCRGR